MTIQEIVSLLKSYRHRVKSQHALDPEELFPVTSENLDFYIEKLQSIAEDIGHDIDFPEFPPDFMAMVGRRAEDIIDLFIKIRVLLKYFAESEPEGQISGYGDEYEKPTGQAPKEFPAELARYVPDLDYFSDEIMEGVRTGNIRYVIAIVDLIKTELVHSLNNEIVQHDKINLGSSRRLTLVKK